MRNELICVYIYRTFTVVHFAGEVNYTAAGFIEKNKDELSQDITQIFGVHTENKLLKEMQRNFVRIQCIAHEQSLMLCLRFPLLFRMRKKPRKLTLDEGKKPKRKKQLATNSR